MSHQHVLLRVHAEAREHVHLPDALSRGAALFAGNVNGIIVSLKNEVMLNLCIKTKSPR